MVVFDIALYGLVVLVLAILIPVVCIETASFFAGMRQQTTDHQDGHGVIK